MKSTEGKLDSGTKTEKFKIKDMKKKLQNRCDDHNGFMFFSMCICMLS